MDSGCPALRLARFLPSVGRVLTSSGSRRPAVPPLASGLWPLGRPPETGHGTTGRARPDPRDPDPLEALPLQIRAGTALGGLLDRA